MLDFLTELSQCGKITLERDFDLKDMTSFKIGGKADFAVFPKDVDSLIEVASYVKQNKIKHIVVGKCSNLLFSDCGYNGVVIFTGKINEISVSGDKIKAASGVSLTHLSNIAEENFLSGLEFAYGIPGSVGGAVYMNAGAYGGEISQVLLECEYYDGESIIRKSSEEIGFSYRRSMFTGGNYIILSAVFSLKEGRREDIKALMEKNMRSRKEKQPLEYPSAGSVFKRPEGHFAAALIDKCNFRGFSEGGAQVSEKHAGFIINKGNASSNNVKRLIEIIKERVFEQTGITLETEIRFID